MFFSNETYIVFHIACKTSFTLKQISSWLGWEVFKTSLYGCVFIYINVSAHTHIHICTHTHTHTHTHIHICIHINTHTHTHIYVYTHTHTHTHKYIHTNNVHIHIYISLYMIIYKHMPEKIHYTIRKIILVYKIIYYVLEILINQKYIPVFF